MSGDNMAESKDKTTYPKRKTQKETKVLTTFSIEQSFKSELEDLFRSMGLGWSAGIRFVLRDFYRHNNNANNDN